MIYNIITKSTIRIMVPEILNRYSFYIKPTVRLILIILFVTSTFSITVSWTSVFSLFFLLMSYLLFKSKGNESESCKAKVSLSSTRELYNPYKGKTGQGYLSKEKAMNIALAIEEYAVDDAGSAECLKDFEIIKAQSECIFAKKTKPWGSPDYDETISLEENMRRVYPTLLKFTLAFLDVGTNAFVIGLPGRLFGENIETFAVAVRKTLLTLKQEDLKRIYKQKIKDRMTAISTNNEGQERAPISPISSNKKPPPTRTEDTKLWGKKSWVYEINKITFFVTTFAPFYPETNSRYSYGSKDCYILFQPEISFAVQDIPNDTPNTNWVCPVTVRDKIRVAFDKAGRIYEPPMVHDEPMVFDIVKRIYPEDEVVRWWDP